MVIVISVLAVIVFIVLVGVIVKLCTMKREKPKAV
jgi:energy-converting hydrogenase Eha subunit A